MNDDFGAALDRWLTTEPDVEYDSKYRHDCPPGSGCKVCDPFDVDEDDDEAES